VFEANSTAYMVMSFERGQSFENWLKALGRPPSQEELDRIAEPLLDALEAMHAVEFLHRDIAPDNIIVRPDGSPVLLDFGAARRAVGEMSRALTGIVKAGYSPQEQYATDSRLQGPWTDLYAFGGTLYRGVTGRPPDEATLRGMEDRMPSAARAAAGSYRPGFLAAIDACLGVKIASRPKSVAELRPLLLRASLGGSLSARPLGGVSFLTVGKALPSGLGKRPVLAAIAGLVLIGGIYGGVEYARRSADPAGRDRDAAAHASEAAAVWDKTKNTTSITLLEAFIARYRGTYYAELAKTRLAELKGQQPASPTPSTESPSPRINPQPPSAPPPKSETGQSAWVKLCENSQAPGGERKVVKTCITHHERLDGNTGAVMVSAALGQMEGRAAQHLMVMVPPGVNQSAGLRLDIYPQELWERAQKGQSVDESRLYHLNLNYGICNRQGCAAETEANAFTLGWLKYGGGMIATATNSSGSRSAFPIPLHGFAASYAGDPVDNQRYAAARKELLRKIELRRQQLEREKGAKN
jgi:serine/threonine protein kinase